MLEKIFATMRVAWVAGQISARHRLEPSKVLPFHHPLAETLFSTLKKESSGVFVHWGVYESGRFPSRVSGVSLESFHHSARAGPGPGSVRPARIHARARARAGGWVGGWVGAWVRGCVRGCVGASVRA